MAASAVGILVVPTMMLPELRRIAESGDTWNNPLRVSLNNPLHISLDRGRYAPLHVVSARN
jgi:hypothetical protein